MILEVACSASVNLSLIPIFLNSFFIFGSLSRSVDLILTLNYQMHHPNTTYVIHWHIWLFSPFLIHFSLFFIIFNPHTEREKKTYRKKRERDKVCAQSLSTKQGFIWAHRNPNHWRYNQKKFVPHFCNKDLTIVRFFLIQWLKYSRSRWSISIQTMVRVQLSSFPDFLLFL